MQQEKGKRLMKKVEKKRIRTTRNGTRYLTTIHQLQQREERSQHLSYYNKAVTAR